MSISRVFLVSACLLALVSVAYCQFFDFFNSPQAANLVAPSTRDPRGPVVFPPSAPGTETSGVRVGASGYGFVPGPPRAAAGHGPFAGYQSW